jgi:DNA primase
MDVIAMHQAGLNTAVAPLGTALTERQARLLARYARQGVLCFDSDEAGRRATGRALEIFETAGLECRVMTVSGGKDPADLVQAGKPEALHAAFQAAPSAFEHLLAQARGANDASRPEGKQRIVETLRSYLATVGSPIRRDSYITMVADILDVGVNSVLDELGRGAHPGRQASPIASTGETKGRPARLSDELYLMVAVAANRDYFGEVRKSISLDDLTDESARVVYVALEECFRNGEQSLDAFVRRLGDERLELVVMSRLASEEFGTNATEVIGDGIRTLRARVLERRGKAINARLVTMGAQDAGELRELLEEKMYVDRQLQEMKVAGDA